MGRIVAAAGAHVELPELLLERHASEQIADTLLCRESCVAIWRGTGDGLRGEGTHGKRQRKESSAYSGLGCEEDTLPEGVGLPCVPHPSAARMMMYDVREPPE